MFIPENDTDYFFEMLSLGSGYAIARDVLKGSINPNLLRSDGVPLLNMAVMQNCEDLVKALIDKRADIDAQDKEYGQTALYIACSRGLPGALDLLLDAGANPDISDHEKISPLHILAGSADRDSFMMMRQLLIAGAEPNIVAHDGKTPLHDTIHVGDWFKTKLLIHAGADVRASYKGALAFQMVEASIPLAGLESLVGDAAICFGAERMLDKSLSEWRNNKVKNPDFPFTGCCP